MEADAPSSLADLLDRHRSPARAGVAEGGVRSLTDLLDAHRGPTVGERIETALSEAAGGAAEVPASLMELPANLAGSSAPWAEGLRAGAEAYRRSAREGRLSGTALSLSGAPLLEDAPQVPADSLLNRSLPNALGQTAGFAAGGMAGAGTKLGAMGATMLGGASVAGSAAWYDAKAHGASDEDAWKAFALNAGAGTSEALPVGKLLARIVGRAPGLREILLGGLEEAVQEFGQEGAANLIASAIYDEDRELLEGLGEAGTVGGLTGLLLTAAGVGGRRGADALQRRAADPGAGRETAAGTPTADRATASETPDAGAQDPPRASLPPRETLPRDEAEAVLGYQTAAGFDVRPVEEIDPWVDEFLSQRGMKPVYVERVDGERNARPAALLPGGIVVLDGHASQGDRRRALVFHEAVHEAVRQDPKLLPDLAEALATVLPAAKDAYSQDWSQTGGQALSDDALTEEGLARAAEDLAPFLGEALASPEGVAELARKPGLLQRLVDALVKALSRVPGARVLVEARARQIEALEALRDRLPEAGPYGISREAAADVALQLRRGLNSILQIEEDLTAAAPAAPEMVSWAEVVAPAPVAQEAQAEPRIETQTEAAPEPTPEPEPPESVTPHPETKAAEGETKAAARETKETPKQRRRREKKDRRQEARRRAHGRREKVQQGAEPEADLVAFIRSHGGVRGTDTLAGDVRSIVGPGPQRRAHGFKGEEFFGNLVHKKGTARGVALDELALLAEEQGYVTEAERQDLSAFIDLIGEAWGDPGGRVPGGLGEAGEKEAARLAAEHDESYENLARSAGYESYAEAEADGWKRVPFAVGAAESQWSPRFAAAWHGSGADFDKFDLTYVGTGEGAQAYGWGLYFASNEGVAKWYRDSMQARAGGPVVTFPEDKRERVRELVDRELIREYGQPSFGQPSVDRWIGAVRETLEHWGNSSDFLSALRGHAKHMRQSVRDLRLIDAPLYEVEEAEETAVETEIAIKLVEEGLVDVEPLQQAARLYRVNLAPAEDEYLLWDEPLSKQSEKVREALGRLVSDDTLDKGTVSDLRDSMQPFEENSTTGNSVYNLLWDNFDAPVNRGRQAKEASLTLLKAGIRGIKYKDVGARGTDRESYNYVLFDDRDVSIDAKFAAASQKDSKPNPFSRPDRKIPESTWDKFRRKFQDYFLPVRRLVEEFERTGRVPTNAHPEKEEALFYGRVEKRAAEDYEEGGVGHRLLAALAKHSISVEDAGDYLLATHVPVRNRVLIKRNPQAGYDAEKNPPSGVPDSLARKVQRQYEAKNKEGFQEVRKIATELMDQNLANRVGYGLMKQEEADGWKKVWGDTFVPFRTDFEDVPPSKIGQGFDIRGPESPRAEARGEPADNPLLFALKVYEAGIVRGEKNKVDRALLNLIRANPDPTKFGIKKVGTSSKSETGEDTGGLHDDLSKVSPELRKEFASPDGRVVGVKVDGERYLIEFNDPKVAQAMKRSGMTSPIPVLGSVSRFLSMAHTQYDPSFILVNFLRDRLTAKLNLTHEQGEKFARAVTDMRRLGKTFRGLARALKDPKARGEIEDAYREFAAEGGKSGFFHSPDFTERWKQTEREVRHMAGKATLTDKARRWLNEGFISRWNEAAENAVRLSAYMHARSEGWSKRDAAYLAKELTINFNRKGEFGPFLNSWAIFYNAGVQGSTRTLKSLDTAVQKRRFGPLSKLLGLGIGTAVINHIVGAADWDDDGENDWAAIPEHEKQRNLILMTPWGHVKIPMPYGYGVFPLLGQKLVDVAAGGQSVADATHSVVETAGEGFLPIPGGGTVAQRLAPSAWSPIQATLDNVAWYGGPVAPQDNPFAAPTPDSQKAWRSTSAPAKAVAGALNAATGGDEWRGGLVDVSPASLEYVLESYTAGPGRWAKRGYRSAEALLKGEAPRPQDIPLFRRFFGTTPEQRAAEVFYGNLEEVEVAEREVKDRAARGRPAAPERTQRLARLAARARGHSRRISALRNQGTDEAEQKIRDEYVRFNKAVKEARRGD